MELPTSEIENEDNLGLNAKSSDNSKTIDKGGSTNINMNKMWNNNEIIQKNIILISLFLII